MSKAPQPQQPRTEREEPGPITFTEFLEATPPSQMRRISDLCIVKPLSSGERWHELNTPALELHCTSETCNGTRFFRYVEGTRNIERNTAVKFIFFTYQCSNCRKFQKIFSFYVEVDGTEGGDCYKFGEFPAFGPPTPARLIRLFGNDREIFLKGRRCENQGLGIGAFVYYRRVVENHKNQILDEIIRVSQKVGAPKEIIAALEGAKSEIQFSKAITSLKDAIPQALLINGHNPLTLLHSALSSGLHEQSDEKCLELAQDIRVVLIELAERLGQALKDEAELSTAVTRLLNIKQQK